MTFLPKAPIARPRRAAPAAAAGGDVSLQELYIARRTAAKFAQLDHALLPIFERIEREIAAREARMHALSRAAAAATTPAYIEGETA